MKTMKLIPSLAVLLTLVAHEAAAQEATVRETAAYVASGGGCTDKHGRFGLTVQWWVPSGRSVKGGVNLKQWENCIADGRYWGKVTNQVVTDKNTLPTMIAFTPDPNDLAKTAVKYSSLGSCGPTLTAEKTSIVVTVNATQVTIECSEKGFRHDSLIITQNPITFTRVR